MPMNWQYFKPDFSDKLEEDPEGYTFRTTDWMDTHNFTAEQGVQKVPLALAGEARLWC